MQESPGKTTNDNPELDKRRSAATNAETLSDMEESDSDSGATTDDLNAGPSPDGTLDEGDELKDAGPL